MQRLVCSLQPSRLLQTQTQQKTWVLTMTPVLTASFRAPDLRFRAFVQALA